MKKALILVDIQNDFLTGGSLAVPRSDEILPVVSRLVKMPFDVKVATMDWHPPHHYSFASTWEKKQGDTVLIEGEEQTLWADHCIQDSAGAALSKVLEGERFHFIVHKGSDQKIDSYSTFFDNRRQKSTGLETYLKELQVDALYFAGLATDYCVYYSAIDAVELGFCVYVIIDGCRGIDLFPGDVALACFEMEKKGVRFITADEVFKDDV